MFENKIKMQKHDLVFLDNASTTFKPQQVIDACNYYYTRETSNSGRGDYDVMYNVDQKVLEIVKNASGINLESTSHNEIEAALKEYGNLKFCTEDADDLFDTYKANASCAQSCSDNASSSISF